MITEAIILAGGLGIRLRSAIPDLPKCMAPVAGKPFMDYVLEHLASQSINRFIMALGYQSAIIQEHVQQHFSDWDISFSLEEEPLGTGGAIVKAGKQVKGKYAVVANGDTLYKASIQNAMSFFEAKKAACLLYLKPMKNVDRYGVVEVNNYQQITSFREKQFYKDGLINGGLYVLDVHSFLQQLWPGRFSFEKDYLEAKVDKTPLYGLIDDAYFIDIGMPADFERANLELQTR